MTPDGAVRALVGGKNYAESQYNRAVAAKRQPGSAFKPFVYLTALERGLTPDTVREDKPVMLKGWKPENYSHEYHGPVTLTQALSQSLNTVSVRLTLEVGPAAVAKTAYRLGIASKLDANPSLALGTSEVSLIELVSAYAPFANGGDAVAPHVVERVRTQAGKVLFARKAQNLGRIVEPRYVAMMNAMMRETIVERHRAEGAAAGLARRRQDRHQPGFPRRLVHRLHRPPRRRRLARQRRFLADQEGDRRRPAGRNLDPGDEGRPSRRAGRRPAGDGGRAVARLGRASGDRACRRCPSAASGRPGRRASGRIGGQAAAHRSQHRRLVPRPAVRAALTARHHVYRGRSISFVVVVPAQAGTHIPEAGARGTMGPRFRGDDSILCYLRSRSGAQP